MPELQSSNLDKIRDEPTYIHISFLIQIQKKYVYAYEIFNNNIHFSFQATHSFPYVKKRIEVAEGGRKEVVLTPIEVAIDEMQVKVSDLKEVINNPLPDMKRLQLKLQGGVSAQVSVISVLLLLIMIL